MQETITYHKCWMPSKGIGVAVKTKAGYTFTGKNWEEHVNSTRVTTQSPTIIDQQIDRGKNLIPYLFAGSERTVPYHKYLQIVKKLRLIGYLETFSGKTIDELRNALTELKTEFRFYSDLLAKGGMQPEDEKEARYELVITSIKIEAVNFKLNTN